VIKKSSYDKLLKLNEASCDKELTASDKVVFQRLVWRVNLKTGACFPSVGLIAEELSMTDRSVRKCMSRLEKQGYIKRLIHPGRTKANDYLIPGLNTERRFRKTGTCVPENRNCGSAHIYKERKKEREASEGRMPNINVSFSTEKVAKIKVVEDQFQNQLVDALGGCEQGWAVLMHLRADLLEELQGGFLNGSMSIAKAVRAIRTELTAEDAGN
jgi:hypothetical protein